MEYSNIDAERARHGLTMDDLPQHLGVTRKTLYNWIDRGDIPQGKLLQMAELFDACMDYLLGLEPPQHQAKEANEKNRPVGRQEGA